jgi:hypothetical protein
VFHSAYVSQATRQIPLPMATIASLVHVLHVPRIFSKQTSASPTALLVQQMPSLHEVQRRLSTVHATQHRGIQGDQSKIGVISVCDAYQLKTVPKSSHPT